MNDPHNLMSYARNIFPRSLNVNNYQQKRVCLSDALFWTMSAFLYEGKTNLDNLSREVSTILTRKGLLEKEVVDNWIKNHFIPDAETLIRREYQKHQRLGKIWGVDEYLKHRGSGASMHNEAMSYLLLLEPKLGVYSSVWNALSEYLVLYTDSHSWKKDKKNRDYYNMLFCIQYEHEISEEQALVELDNEIKLRECLLTEEIKEESSLVQIFLNNFKLGASVWCETTPRYHKI